MQKSKNELIRTKMSMIFYTRFILCVFPIAITCYSIYWIILTSKTAWVKSIGANLLVANVFNCLFAISSFVFILFCVLGILQQNSFISQGYFVSTILCFLTSFISLSLSSDQSSNKYILDLIDYCQRNPTAGGEFVILCSSENSRWSISNYVRKRTTESYDVFVGIVSPWVVIFVVFLLMCAAVPDNSNVKGQLNSNNCNSNIAKKSATTKPNHDEEDQNIPILQRDEEERLNLDIREEESYEYVDEEEEDEIGINVRNNYDDDHGVDPSASIHVDDNA